MTRMGLGPLPSEWVRQWALDASESMRQATGRAAGAMPFRVGEEFFVNGRSLVREWVKRAHEDEVFEWEGDVDPDFLLPLVQWWHNLAMVRRDLIDRGDGVTMHPDAEQFAIALRQASLGALVSAGRMAVTTAARMDERWPVLGPLGARDRDVAQHERHAGRTAG